MPIRFRCAYCNQLMGISRRKAGTVIRCPKCAGQVIVPHPVPDQPPPEPAGQRHAAAPPPGPGLFEGSDIDQVLGTRPSVPSAQQPPAANPQPIPLHQSDFDVEPLAGTPMVAPGIFLNTTKLTLISVGIVLLLGLAFFLGLLVGRQ